MSSAPATAPATRDAGARTSGRSGEGFARGVLVTAACLGVSRFCGLGRELLVAARSGPTPEADAFYTALVLVTVVTSVLGMVTPNVVATGFYAGGQAIEDRRRQIWGCQVRWAACLGAGCFLIAALADPIWGMLGTSGEPGIRPFGVAALRLAMAILFFQGLFLPLAAVGNSEGWHTPVALLSTGFPLGGLLGALLLYRPMGLMGLLVGILVVSVFQVGLLIHYLGSRGLAPPPPATFARRAALPRLLALAAPVALGAALLKLDTILLVRIAAGLRTGDVFLLSLAVMLVNVPMSVANQAVTMISAPSLVREYASGRRDCFGGVLIRSSEMATLLIAPVAVLMVVDAEGLVSLLFERGRFGPDSVARTAWPLRVWACASPLLTLTLALDEALMATGARRLVALGRGATVALLVPACLLGAAAGGLAGMVAAYAAVSIARAPLTAAALARTTGMAAAQLWGSQARVLACAALAAATAWAVGSAATASGMGILGRMVAEAATIALVGGAACLGVGVEGVQMVRARLTLPRAWATSEARR